MQKTHLPKVADLKPIWYIIDAKDQVVGKIATKITNALRGKNKVDFTPHMNCGDYVIVINAHKIVFTGKKLDQKSYFSHSRFKGGLKTTSAKDVLKRRPMTIIREAVKNMLPKNKLQKVYLARLKIFASETHNHEAQKPIVLN